MGLPTPYQEYIHLSRYARYRYDDNRRETWTETVERYINFFKEHLQETCNHKLTPAIVKQVRDAILNLEVMPSMRERGQGSFLISNNAQSLRGRKRMTGQSLYYPRVMMRTLAQVLTEEYSEFGVHVANVVIDGTIDSPGTRAMPRSQQNPELIINPVKIAEAFYYLHTQDKSCWTHELQLTPYPTKPSF
mgnify:CR=1 FL=1